MAQWNLNGKSILVTGGASGLGAGCLKELLKAGAKQIAVLDIAEDAGKAYVEELDKTYPGKVIFIKCDVGDEESISGAFNQVVTKFKTLDAVFNIAGIMNEAPHIWWKMCEVNVQGLVSLTMKAIKHMRKDEGGSGGTVINIASTAALTVIDLLPIYNGTKMAVLHFSQSIATDELFENTGVRILTICPGATDTPLLQGLGERGRDPESRDKLEHLMEQSAMFIQSKESAIKAILKVYEEGSNGSIWVTIDNKPAKDVTPVIKAAFKSFEDAMLN